MNSDERIQSAKSHIEMLDAKSADDPRALAMRALICHLRHDRPSLNTLLAVAQECGVAGFGVFSGLQAMAPAERTEGSAGGAGNAGG